MAKLYKLYFILLLGNAVYVLLLFNYYPCSQSSDHIQGLTYQNHNKGMDNI